MNRKAFLTLAASIGGIVGVLALAAPHLVLKAKGVDSLVAGVWMREVGVLLLASAACAAAVRSHEASPTLLAILWANAFVQFGLLAVEAAALATGLLALPGGVLPNCVAHCALGMGFGWCALGVRRELALR